MSIETSNNIPSSSSSSSWFTLKIVFIDILINLLDISTDLAQSLNLMRANDEHFHPYGWIGLSLLWMPGVVGGLYVITMYRHNQSLGFTLALTLCIAVLFPIVPLITSIYVLWILPSPTEVALPPDQEKSETAEMNHCAADTTITRAMTNTNTHHETKFIDNNYLSLSTNSGYNNDSAFFEKTVHSNVLSDSALSFPKVSISPTTSSLPSKTARKGFNQTSEECISVRSRQGCHSRINNFWSLPNAIHFSNMMHSLAGSIESPLQLILQLWLIVNGQILPPWRSTLHSKQHEHHNNGIQSSLQFTDWSSNSIQVPSLPIMSLVLSILNIFKAVICLNALVTPFRVSKRWRENGKEKGLQMTSSVSKTLLSISGSLPYLISGTLFRVPTILFLVTYLNSFGFIPLFLYWIFIIVTQYHHCLNVKHTPIWSMAVVSILLPVPFFPFNRNEMIDNGSLIVGQKCNYIRQALLANTFYGSSLCLTYVVINYNPQWNYNSKVILNNLEFNLNIAMFITFGIFNVYYAYTLNIYNYSAEKGVLYPQTPLLFDEFVPHNDLAAIGCSSSSLESELSSEPELLAQLNDLYVPISFHPKCISTISRTWKSNELLKPALSRDLSIYQSNMDDVKHEGGNGGVGDSNYFVVHEDCIGDASQTEKQQCQEMRSFQLIHNKPNTVNAPLSVRERRILMPNYDTSLLECQNVDTVNNEESVMQSSSAMSRCKAQFIHSPKYPKSYASGDFVYDALFGEKSAMKGSKICENILIVFNVLTMLVLILAFILVNVCISWKHSQTFYVSTLLGEGRNHSIIIQVNSINRALEEVDLNKIANIEGSLQLFSSSNNSHNTITLSCSSILMVVRSDWRQFILSGLWTNRYTKAVILIDPGENSFHPSFPLNDIRFPKAFPSSVLPTVLHAQRSDVMKLYHKVKECESKFGDARETGSIELEKAFRTPTYNEGRQFNFQNNERVMKNCLVHVTPHQSSIPHPEYTCSFSSNDCPNKCLPCTKENDVKRDDTDLTITNSNLDVIKSLFIRHTNPLEVQGVQYRSIECWWGSKPCLFMSNILYEKQDHCDSPNYNNFCLAAKSEVVYDSHIHRTVYNTDSSYSIIRSISLKKMHARCIRLNFDMCNQKTAQLRGGVRAHHFKGKMSGSFNMSFADLNQDFSNSESEISSSSSVLNVWTKFGRWQYKTDGWMKIRYCIGSIPDVLNSPIDLLSTIRGDSNYDVKTSTSSQHPVNNRLLCMLEEARFVTDNPAEHHRVMGQS